MAKKFGKTKKGLPANFEMPGDIGRVRNINVNSKPSSGTKEIQVEEVHRQQFSTEWLDTNTFVPDESGNLAPAGTCLKVGPNIIYLKFLSDQQLAELKAQVVSAVNHEQSKR
jgi:hypothetical protein